MRGWFHRMFVSVLSRAADAKGASGDHEIGHCGRASAVARRFLHRGMRGKREQSVEREFRESKERAENRKQRERREVWRRGKRVGRKQRMRMRRESGKISCMCCA